MLPRAEAAECKTRDYEEAVSLARGEFAVEQRKAPLAALSLSPEGLMTLPGGDPLAVSRPAMANMVKLCGIPWGYSAGTSVDLFLYSVERQKRERNQNLVHPALGLATEARRDVFRRYREAHEQDGGILPCEGSTTVFGSPRISLALIGVPFAL